MWWEDAVRLSKTTEKDVPKEIQDIINNWSIKKNDYLDAWHALDEKWGAGGWPAKDVKTRFIYKGLTYVITPDTIGLKTADPWDEGFLEFIQSDITKDLKEIGATDIYNTGYID